MIHSLRVRFSAAGSAIGGNVLRIYVLQFATLGLSLVSSVVVARELGPAAKGVVELYTLLGSFISEIGAVGFNSGLLYYLSNRRVPLEEAHGTGIAFSLIGGIVAAIVGMLGLPLWRRVLPGLPDWAVLVAFGTAAATFYRVIWQNLLIGINRAVNAYWLGLLLTVCTVTTILVLWILGRLTYGTVIAVVAGSSVIGSSVALEVLRRYGGPLKASALLASQSLRFGLPLYIGLVANTLNFRIDQLILNMFLDTRAVGIYAISVRWAEMLFLLDSALVASELHRIGSSSRPESLQLTRQLAGKQAMISGGAGLLVATFAYPLLLVLYGSAYLDAVVPLIILVPGVIAWSIAKVLSQCIVYQCGSRWYPTSCALAGMVANIVLNVLLIPHFGIAGAAVASLCSYSVVLALIALRFLGLTKEHGSVLQTEVGHDE